VSECPKVWNGIISEAAISLLTLKINVMAEKKIKPQDNHANQKNANKGTSGVNKAYAKAQGNRGKQIQQNRAKKKSN